MFKLQTFKDQSVKHNWISEPLLLRMSLIPFLKMDSLIQLVATFLDQIISYIKYEIKDLYEVY